MATENCCGQFDSYRPYPRNTVNDMQLVGIFEYRHGNAMDLWMPCLAHPDSLTTLKSQFPCHS